MTLSGKEFPTLFTNDRKMNQNILKSRCVQFFLGVILMMSSCQDKVDESNLYVFVSDVVTSYIDKSSELNYFGELMRRVHTGRDASSSTFDALLSTRGNYTCFIPTNEAIQSYVDSLYKTKDMPMIDVPDSTAEFIVRNCIIDNGNENAYESVSFQDGAFQKPSMGNRFLTVLFDTIKGGQLAIYINTYSRILQRDIELENGIIHVVNQVISPATSSLPELIAATPNTRIFGHLLQVTGWSDQMHGYWDEAYAEKRYENSYTYYGWWGETPKYHMTGFTAFVECDSLLEKEFGVKLQMENSIVTNWDEIDRKIQEVCQEHYPDATHPDMKDQGNAVNQFVSYHLLDASIPFNKLVIHYNEVGYAYTRPDQLGINHPQYYEPMGKPRRILKITEGSQTQGKRINRWVKKYNLDNYREVEVPIPGTLVTATNYGYDNSALNGFYYMIDDVLWYDSDVKNKVLNERIRWDGLDLNPELMTNGMRNCNWNTTFFIPRGYCKNMVLNNDETYAYLLTTWGIEGDLAYEGDEPTFVGQYDLTFRLPPVPVDGTYEIRICYAVSSARGMCQAYFGTNPENLQALGLPTDMRLNTSNVTIGWKLDTDNEEENRENDKNMYNHGYMKCPACFGYPSKVGSVSGRNAENGVKTRRILYRGSLKAQETYYMRFKNVLENPAAQFDFDFFELVPKSVYAGVEQEDIW